MYKEQKKLQFLVSFVGSLFLDIFFQIKKPPSAHIVSFNGGNSGGKMKLRQLITSFSSSFYQQAAAFFLFPSSSSSLLFTPFFANSVQSSAKKQKQLRALECFSIGDAHYLLLLLFLFCTHLFAVSFCLSHFLSFYSFNVEQWQLFTAATSVQVVLVIY